ncbi:hypothetical protein PKOR_11860 [Pontibacter korlensis]|uniref:Uncharacterized protein n=1 Tax=Pontibacter korlensis TaxID=400092 RepID=A0A0E3ZEC2_9BACT|nr:hypothetical protein PKOR_11860 [Pontibacter korlensis]
MSDFEKVGKPSINLQHTSFGFYILYLLLNTSYKVSYKILLLIQAAYAMLKCITALLRSSKMWCKISFKTC